jgi:membrane-bound lytic murein transglycosylase A
LRFRFAAPGLAVALALILAACATTPSPVSPPPPSRPPHGPERPQPPQPPRPEIVGQPLTVLPGWAAEDHSAALAAVVETCRAKPLSELAPACARATAAGPLPDAAARALMEELFRAVPIGDAAGMLTAYFSPEYEARFSRGGAFTAPVRPRPADLAIPDPDARDPARPGWKGEGRMVDGRLQPYPGRAAIEATEEQKPLAWMRPEDLFFLQIQGSGTLVLADGRRKRAIFAATNGLPFKGIATPMRDQGLLPEDGTSGEAIRGWLADHRGPQADAVMDLNPRYVFFRMDDDDGAEATGAANVPMIAGRAIAVDPAFHDYGALYWIDGQAPSLSGAFPRYSRLVAALDTGGAIRGQVRADLYMGRGATAGAQAGRVKHELRMWRLVAVPARP